MNQATILLRRFDLTLAPLLHALLATHTALNLALFYLLATLLVALSRPAGHALRLLLLTLLHLLLIALDPLAALDIAPTLTFDLALAFDLDLWRGFTLLAFDPSGPFRTFGALRALGAALGPLGAGLFAGLAIRVAALG